MIMDYDYTSAFWSFILNGILLLIALIILLYNYNYIMSDSYRTLIVILLFGIAIGIHSILHFYYVYYDMLKKINS